MLALFGIGNLMTGAAFWTVIASILMLVLSNKAVYKIFNPIGFALRTATLRFLTEKNNVGAKMLGWVFDTVGTVFESIVDGWKGVNKYAPASIEKARTKNADANPTPKTG